MKILLVVDGSSYSILTTQIIRALRLPAGTEITVLTVVPEPTFLGSVTLDTIMTPSEYRAKTNDEQQGEALELVKSISQAVGQRKLKVDTMVRWGNPAEEILSLAQQEKVSLIVLGVKGLTDPDSYRLGSVALKVAKYANSSVLLVRKKTVSLAEDPPKKKEITRIKRVLVTTDGSKYADDGIRMSLDLFSPRRTEILILTALHSHHESWWKTPTLNLGDNREVLTKIQKAEEIEAGKIIRKAERKFQDKGYKTTSIIEQGEASDCIITAAIEHSPDIVVLGSKGLTGIESYLLGSVVERVARYTNCSVLIGRSM